MRHNLHNFISDHELEIGIGSIIETNIIEAYKTSGDKERERGLAYDEIKDLESLRLIKALLTSGYSDESLKRYVFERWWTINRLDHENEGYFKVEDILTWRFPGKEAKLKHWAKELPTSNHYTPIGEVLRNLYLSDEKARFLMVRKLMLGEGGVLQENKGKEVLIDAFMDTWLKSGDDQGEALMRNVLSSLLNSESPEKTYQLIGPILQELMLQPPKRSPSDENIAEAKSKEVIQSLISRKKLEESSLFGNEIPTVTNKILNLMNGTTDQQQSGNKKTVNRLLGIFEHKSPEEIAQISPTEFWLMTGKKAGSFGIKNLQLARMYFEIPEEEQEKYDEVFDAMKGQTRLQAYKTLWRKAQASPKTAAIFDEINIFGKRVGGGSLMTVYETTMNDGSLRVTGVRNPNAEYHVLRFAETTRSTLEIALQNDPDNHDLMLMQSLVTDVVTWIRDELNDVEYSQKDPVFRQQNDTSIGQGFKKGRSRYDLFMPKSYDTGTTWIRHEDYVAGVNLNNLEVIEGETSIADQKISQTDFKDATSLLIRNMLYQIRHGSYIHPDAHGGNFRITDNNMRLAVLDRHNLIRITDDMRITLENTITAVAKGDTKEAIKSLMHGVAPDNQNIESIASNLAQKLKSSNDISKGLSDIILPLKKTGVQIPINLSLVLRNIFNISRLSKKAGFESLIDGFLHTASDEEISDISTMLH